MKYEASLSRVDEGTAIIKGLSLSLSHTRPIDVIRMKVGPGSVESFAL